MNIFAEFTTNMVYIIYIKVKNIDHFHQKQRLLKMPLKVGIKMKFYYFGLDA